MIDIEKQIDYWRDGAAEDWEIAQDLVGRGKVRHGLFLAHLAVEKALKAHVRRDTQDIAPRTHNLSRLAELSGLALSQEQSDLFAEMNPFNIEGRYPGTLGPLPSQAEAEAYTRRTQEVYEWLINRLSG